MSAAVDRAFVRLAEGLVHYRHAGAAQDRSVPLYMAHAGPGSSRGLMPLIAELGAGRRTLAPDMFGNGDSDPPARRDTDIAYYADCAVRLLDALGIDTVDFYGTHTGAMIGIELATSHPDRVRRLVLDGIVLMDPERRAFMVANYAPRMQPDDHGGYLAWAYQFCRDMMLFYPYFERDAAHRTNNGAPTPEFLHLMVVDVLKALTTYDCAYRAAFAYDSGAALAKVARPTLITSSERDPLHKTLPQAAEILPAAETCLHPLGVTPAQVAARIAAFLDSGD